MSIIRFLQSFSSPFIDNFFQAVTFMGEETAIILIMVTIYWCLNKKLALRLGFIQLFSAVTNGAVKDLVNEARPIGQEGIFSLRVTTATGSSFPSGHTQGTATFWTALMVLYRKKWLYITGTVMIVLVGTSRLYLGLHWPVDVLGGAALGIFSMFLANTIVNAMYSRKDNRYMLLLMFPAVIGLFFFHSNDYVKSVALSLSFYLGYIIEDNFIKFDPRQHAARQAIKVVIGVIGLLFVEQGLKLMLPDNNLGTFICYSAVGLWITAAAPLIFIILRLSPSESAKAYKKI
ncbi:MAG: phosphatase PAP2 family protein [Bacillota bacterium]|nr:phosphatase PAP2 family protein [Bacillota bacterium]